MWDKPREITASTGMQMYSGNGFEISIAQSAGTISAQGALDGFIRSRAHYAVMINGDRWSAKRWQSIGAAVEGGFAVIWFGEEPDPNR